MPAYPLLYQDWIQEPLDKGFLTPQEAWALEEEFFSPTPAWPQDLMPAVHRARLANWEPLQTQ